MAVESLPRIGLGTWPLTGDDCFEAVSKAITAGYRHIDTAQMYDNEVSIGRAINGADVPRQELFIATKINHHRDYPAGKFDEVIDCVLDSLDRLDLDVIDLLYVHWPVGDYDPNDTLAALDKLHEDELIRHIGLSNCTVEILNTAIKTLNTTLFAHQIEMHPLFQQKELLQYAQARGHYIIAYMPLAQGAIFNLPEINEVAKRHKISKAQASLAWLTNHENVCAIPRTSNEKHLEENLAARNVKLDSYSMALIRSINREQRFLDPELAPWNQ